MIVNNIQLHLVLTAQSLHQLLCGTATVLFCSSSLHFLEQLTDEVWEKASRGYDTVCQGAVDLRNVSEVVSKNIENVQPTFVDFGKCRRVHEPAVPLSLPCCQYYCCSSPAVNIRAAAAAVMMREFAQSWHPWWPHLTTVRILLLAVTLFRRSHLHAFRHAQQRCEDP